MDETAVAPVEAPAPGEAPLQVLRMPWALGLDDPEEEYPVVSRDFFDPVKFPGYRIPVRLHGLGEIARLASGDLSAALVAHYVEGKPASGDEPALPRQPFEMTDGKNKPHRVWLNKPTCRVLANLELMQERVPEPERTTREALVGYAIGSAPVWKGILAFANEVMAGAPKNASPAAPEGPSAPPSDATTSPTPEP